MNEMIEKGEREWKGKRKWIEMFDNYQGKQEEVIDAIEWKIDHMKMTMEMEMEWTFPLVKIVQRMIIVEEWLVDHSYCFNGHFKQHEIN